MPAKARGLGARARGRAFLARRGPRGLKAASGSKGPALWAIFFRIPRLLLDLCPLLEWWLAGASSHSCSWLHSSSVSCQHSSWVSVEHCCWYWVSHLIITKISSGTEQDTGARFGAVQC